MRIAAAIQYGYTATPEKLRHCSCPMEREKDVERYVESEREQFREEWFEYLRESGEEDLYY